MAGFMPSTNTAMMLAMRRIGPIRPGAGFGGRAMPVPGTRTAPPEVVSVPSPSYAPASTGRGAVAKVSPSVAAPVTTPQVQPVRESGIPVRSRPVRARYLPLLSGYWKETLSGDSRGKAGDGDPVPVGRSILGE